MLLVYLSLDLMHFLEQLYIVAHMNLDTDDHPTSHFILSAEHVHFTFPPQIIIR